VEDEPEDEPPAVRAVPVPTETWCPAVVPWSASGPLAAMEATIATRCAPPGMCAPQAGQFPPSQFYQMPACSNSTEHTLVQPTRTPFPTMPPMIRPTLNPTGRPNAGPITQPPPPPLHAINSVLIVSDIFNGLWAAF
jgi:hypothetical protein